MSIRNLTKLFHPERIAVVGASNQPGKVGYTVFRNLIHGGFEGVVYPINPLRESVQGVAAYSRLGALPHAVDLAVVCTPAVTVPEVIGECLAAGVAGAVVVSAGFGETGPAGAVLDARLRELLGSAPEFRLLGPNCLGFMVPGLRLNASFAADLALAGQVALVSQSGALCTSVLDWALRERIGFSTFVSIGNMLDVNFGDLIDFLAADPSTHSLILYVESVTNPREFMSAARAFARKKPLVAFKAGRFAESAQAAASHTGALAGVDEVYEAAFERAGIVRVHRIDELLDCALLLARQRPAPGSRLAVITNAGGPGVIAVDALVEHQGQLARFSPATLAALNEALPAAASRGNPVDLLGDASAERYQQALSAVLRDDGVDGVLVILTPQAMTDVVATSRAVVAATSGRTKPLLAAWMGGARVAAGTALLVEANIPVYDTPESAIRSFLYLVSHGRTQAVLHETPREIPLPFQLPHAELATQAAAVFSDPALGAAEKARRLLELYEIPLVESCLTHSPDEACLAARRLGFPVVLKVQSPEILHKTEVDGVRLDLVDEPAVRAAYAEIVSGVGARRPQATVTGISVEPMISSPTGVELILGAKKDPSFGPVIMIGLGGIAAELLRDYALELPPLSERLARRMLAKLRGAPLLSGFRGRPAVDLDRLIEVLLRFSTLVADCPQIAEFDINPLLALPGGVTALDARLVVDARAVASRPPRFAHLAIRPYPEDWTKRARTRGGVEVLLRPIKPEDEPRWQELLASCSERSLRYRFRYLFQASSHAMAARFCFVDYDREIAIVAEAAQPGRQLLGVARLVADANHEDAEFAVLVADQWQHQGLGGQLLDFALDLAARWGLRRVHGETTADNPAMLAAFRSRGFELRRVEGELILATRPIEPGTVVVPKGSARAGGLPPGSAETPDRRPPGSAGG